MFKTINHIDDLRQAVSGKKEIKFLSQPNGTTIGCYIFMDSKTFDSPEALECRGIAFDSCGKIVSRPLHKFFNIGEKEWLSPQKLLERDDIHAIYEKLDGSMIATAWIDGELKLRSKKSFSSEVVKIATEFVCLPENYDIARFMHTVARRGMTAIFELTHPSSQIVINHKTANLQLLHVRDNVTGEYVMLNPYHNIHGFICSFSIPVVKRIDCLSLQQALESLENMKWQEGYVIQFRNGDMVKIKCPWYLRFHTAISYLRERDIARLALNEELDDVKGALTEIGINLERVSEVETRLKETLSQIVDEIESVYQQGKELDRKSFAIENQGHPLFGLIMQRYLGTDLRLTDWYRRNRLDEDFSLKPLVDELNE